MLLAAMRRRDTPAADLARVLACWLVVILLVQGLAALQTLVRGPAHRHLAPAGTLAAPVTPSAAAQLAAGPSSKSLSHAMSQAMSHAMSHAMDVPHHHAGDEVAVPAGAEAGLDTAACVLMAALAALAVFYGFPVRAAGSARVVSVAWALAENAPPPPRRPPRG